MRAREADAFVSAASSNRSGVIYNVGSGNSYSVNRLVDLLGGERTYIPKRPGEPDCTFADITRIQAELNWRPSVCFEDGVAVMLRNIEGWRDAPVWTTDTIREVTADWFKYLDASRP